MRSYDVFGALRGAQYGSSLYYENGDRTTPIRTAAYGRALLVSAPSDPVGFGGRSVVLRPTTLLRSALPWPNLARIPFSRMASFTIDNTGYNEYT